MSAKPASIIGRESVGLVMHEPKIYRAVMVSSTFTDLQKHRQKVIEAIQKNSMKANVMEHDGARAGVDVIDLSRSTWCANPRPMSVS